MNKRYYDCRDCLGKGYTMRETVDRYEIGFISTGGPCQKCELRKSLYEDVSIEAWYYVVARVVGAGEERGNPFPFTILQKLGMPSHIYVSEGFVGVNACYEYKYYYSEGKTLDEATIPIIAEIGMDYLQDRIENFIR